MKKLLLLLTLAMTAFLVQAQSPGYLNYQGVARNAVGNVISNKTIALRLSIHDGTTTGPVVYSETRVVTTNPFGLFNIQIGSSGYLFQTGSIATVPWLTGHKFIQVEIDPNGGTSFMNVGTTELVSVPFSLYTNQSGDIVLPFSKIQGDNGPLFRLTNTGNSSGSAALEGNSGSNASNVAAIRGIISSSSSGTGSAGIYGYNNGSAAGGAGVWGVHNGAGMGVYGSSTSGTGLYGNSTGGAGVFGQSINGVSVMGMQPANGTNAAGYFENLNPNNNSRILDVRSNGIGITAGVQNLNAANGSTILDVQNGGTGTTANLNATNAANPSVALDVKSAGTGNAAKISGTNPASTKNTLEVQNSGLGDAGLFQINNGANTKNAIEAQTNGTGSAGVFAINNASNTGNALQVATNGTGYALNAISTNATPKALHTQGAIQFSGIGEAANRVLSTDINGNATWQNAAAVGIVSGSGTKNYIAKWTPDGTAVGVSQIQDDGSNLAIGGSIDANYKLSLAGKMHLKASSDNGAIATFENTSTNENSDGIIIKLGRIHGAWNGSSYANVTNPITQGVETQVNQIRNWIYGVDDFNWTQLINLMPSQYLTGTICNLTNLITKKLNDAMGLPLKIGPYSTPAVHIWDETTIFPGLDLDILGSIPALKIPALNIPSVTVIPTQITVMPKLPEIDCSSLPSLSMPTFVFTNVTNTLSNKNEFIAFVDKDDRKLGSIRATSIQDFSYNYFDGQKMLDLAAEFIGIDIVDDFMSVIAGISEMVNDYNKIGVEYSSGHGDYAEWLERADPRETISYGDIVGVKGGKITKTIEGAEQIMAVSKAPIVLGNTPDKGRTQDGNNVAFMGQIPVKIMGPCASGDYIVARGTISGYGVAIHPRDMKVEDFKLSVGRSWDTNDKPGPKMINTVVGVHNNDFLNIIGSLQQRADNADERLKAIEMLLNVQQTKEPGKTSQPAKKAFK